MRSDGHVYTRVPDAATLAPPPAPRCFYGRVPLAAVAATTTCLQFTSFALARTWLPRCACDAHVLLGSEALKMVASVALAFWSGTLASAARGWTDVLPVVACFVVMNMIGMWCTTLVSAALFVVLMQLKLVFTALVSRVVLSRKLKTVQYLALGIITAGCTTVGSTELSQSKSDAEPGHPLWMFGVLGLVLETFLSGVSSVHMQRVLTGDALWARNVQLAMLSIIVYAIIAHHDGRCQTAQPCVTDCVLIALSGFGGISVALTLRYAGAIEKTMATSTAVALTIGMEAIFDGRRPQIAQITGAVNVILAIMQYALAK